MFYLNQKSEFQGLILSIDFEKAFDTVSWKFIDKTLRYYNFGPSIVRWISLFQRGAESCILQNVFISDFFLFKAGL